MTSPAAGRIQRRMAGEGGVLAAVPEVEIQQPHAPLGFYETRVLEALVEQPTTYRGVRFFGGWRRGDGLFPLQEEKIKTQSGGEFCLGCRHRCFATAPSMLREPTCRQRIEDVSGSYAWQFPHEKTRLARLK